MFSLKEKTTAVIHFFLLINNFIFQEITAQIVGGESITINRMPFVVQLRHNTVLFCAGSIISPRHILTAGHCGAAYPHNTIEVISGSHRSVGTEGTVHRVFHAAVHPGFNTFLHNDIAVLTLTDRIQFNPNAQKINLPTRDCRVGEEAILAGWGSLSAASNQIAPILQRAPSTIISNVLCSRRMAPAYPHAMEPVQVCAFQGPGVGTCFRDSGGPLVADNQIFGVVSYGVPCALGFPDVFTRVYAFVPWIERVMAS